MENPYQSPQSVDVVPSAPPPSGESLARLRTIAQRQRLMLLGVLVYAGTIVMPLFSPEHPVMEKVLWLAFLMASLLMATGVASVMVAVDGRLSGVIYWFLVLIPILNLVVLMSADENATGTLQRAGLHFSLLGADMTQFAAREGNELSVAERSDPHADG